MIKVYPGTLRLRLAEGGESLFRKGTMVYCGPKLQNWQLEVKAVENRTF